ncbi:MAG: LAGLIDADG family homing endonuclease [Candidatus Woesearchaeota archaeon]
MTKRYKISNELVEKIGNSSYSLTELTKISGVTVKQIFYGVVRSISELQLKELSNFLDLNDLNLREVKIYTAKNLGKYAYPKQIKVPQKSEKLAEFIGVMLGDGCVTNYENKVKKQYFSGIRVTGNSKNDFYYLTEYVYNLIFDLFGVRASYYISKNSNAINLYVNRINLVKLLRSFGLNSGNKKKNNQKIPDWIFNDKNYLKACVRGLIDTDGSVCPLTGRNYPCIWFKSAIPNLRDSFSEAMDILDIKINKWSGKDTPQTYIGRKDMVRKYYNNIGFSNKYHNDRFIASFKNL